MLKLYRPVRSLGISQGFNESKACAKTNKHGGLFYPIKIIGTRTGLCPPGYANFYKLIGMKNHNGIDQKSWHGEPVYHCADFSGIMKTESDKEGGLGVDIISKEPVLDFQGSKRHVKIRYWHLKTPIGWDGREVKPGDLIGLADNTGASSSDHLHWAPKWCDKNGGNTIARNNGFYGAFDPSPYYFNHLFVLDILGLPADRLSLAQKTSKLKSSVNSLMSRILGRN